MNGWIADSKAQSKHPLYMLAEEAQPNCRQTPMMQNGERTVEAIDDRGNQWGGRISNIQLHAHT